MKAWEKVARRWNIRCLLGAAHQLEHDTYTDGDIEVVIRDYTLERKVDTAVRHVTLTPSVQEVVTQKLIDNLAKRAGKLQ